MGQPAKKPRMTREAAIGAGMDTLLKARARAESCNDGHVIAEFAARGIKASPRVDVFTYNAWLVLGRQVRRGEKGVKVVTFKHPEPRVDSATGEIDSQSVGRRVMCGATVFHVSQTDPVEA